MAIIEMLFITIIVCFIVDCSGVMTDIRRMVANVIKKHTGLPIDYKALKLKPIGCSLCMTWWCCLIYIIVTHNFTLAYVCAAAIYSLVSSNISGFLMVFKDWLAYVENWLQELITR